jgi:hypothetical protein
MGWEAVIHPAKNTGKKMSIGDTLKMYYMFSVIPFILFVVLGAIFVAALSSLVGAIPGLGALSGLGAGLGIGAVVVMAIVYLWIAIPIGILIDAALYHLVGGAILKWFKAGYSATVTSVTYSAMAVVSILWLTFIPIIGSIVVFIFALWSIYVLVTALANQHGTTKGKAFIVWLIWLIIGIAIAAVISVSLFGLISSLAGGFPAGVPTYTTT